MDSQRTHSGPPLPQVDWPRCRPVWRSATRRATHRLPVTLALWHHRGNALRAHMPQPVRPGGVAKPGGASLAPPGVCLATAAMATTWGSRACAARAMPFGTAPRLMGRGKTERQQSCTRRLEVPGRPASALLTAWSCREKRARQRPWSNDARLLWLMSCEPYRHNTLRRPGAYGPSYLRKHPMNAYLAGAVPQNGGAASVGKHGRRGNYTPLMSGKDAQRKPTKSVMISLSASSVCRVRWRWSD